MASGETTGRGLWGHGGWAGTTEKPQRVRKQDTLGLGRGGLQWAREWDTNTLPTLPGKGVPHAPPVYREETRRPAQPQAGLLPSLLLLLLDFSPLPLLRTPLQQDVSQLRRHEVGSLLRAVIPFQVLTWAPPRNQHGENRVVRKGGGEGGRVEQGSQQASRRGKEREKKKTNRQMERPELVVATNPPQKSRNSEAKSPGAERPSCSLDQGTIGRSSSEHGEEAERACKGPRMRDSQSQGRWGHQVGEYVAPREEDVLPRVKKGVRAHQESG